MNNRNVRERDILKLIKGLDITPTMYENATEKYMAVGTYLQEQGLECNVIKIIVSMPKKKPTCHIQNKQVGFFHV
jgi:phosphosulfolactate synthase (CoM biosynthesis protein A)